MSAEAITNQSHDDLIGGEASKGRIPGANKATTGHQYEAILPKVQPKRPQEHLPPPTGRDAPPGAYDSLGGPDVQEVLDSDPEFDIFTGHQTTARQPSPPRQLSQPSPLAPAPDSRTVIDPSPFATPTMAGDTLTGATSQDVHGGYGHPGSGMSSAEMHHEGKPHRKRPMQGTHTLESGEIPRDLGEME
ncbi:hypothetical protein A0H81_02483 [Grifola frondosa]|uniref:Uncharacterized protein n=1 Tax=Grifola frondosa TaxID=5627 RepID=A0A1C7MMX7_GRIFR|nr:hypothetical protein A0H81_02483 [Grifola frondosa]